MSHEIVKGIKFDDNCVFIKSTSNNVSPKTYKWWKCESLSRMLQKDGKDRVDIELVKEYESGNLQPGIKNKYFRAMQRLKRLPEYKIYNWRSGGFGIEYDNIQKNRKSPEFYKLIFAAIKKPDDRKICIIQKNCYEKPCYVFRVNKWSISYTLDKRKAKKFDYPEETTELINSIQGNQKYFSLVFV